MQSGKKKTQSCRVTHSHIKLFSRPSIKSTHCSLTNFSVDSVPSARARCVERDATPNT